MLTVLPICIESVSVFVRILRKLQVTTFLEFLEKKSEAKVGEFV